MQQSFLQMLKALGETVKDAVFPNRCCGCGGPFRPHRTVRKPEREFGQSDAQSLTALADYLCDACTRVVEPIRSPLCTRCGIPFESAEGVDHLCAECQTHSVDFDMARSAGVYRHAFKAIICLYKYQYRSELALPLSRLLWQTLSLNWDPEHFDFVIPVPLHPRRIRERGFNQAELLIRQWPKLARDQGISLGAEKILTRILVRCRHTTPQTGLDRDQRIANLKRAFTLSASGVVQGCRVLLVDDVMTTGATVNACARTLKHAKAASVEVLTLARAV